MTWISETELRFLAERARRLRIGEVAPAAFALLRLELSNLVDEAKRIERLSRIQMSDPSPQQTTIRSMRPDDQAPRDLTLSLSVQAYEQIRVTFPSGSTHLLIVDLAWDGSPILRYSDTQTYEEIACRIMHLFLYGELEYQPPGDAHLPDHTR